LRDLHRDARSFAWLEDLHLICMRRALRRKPGFTLAVFALASASAPIPFHHGRCHLPARAADRPPGE
jgi:hypothetical protein